MELEQVPYLLTLCGLFLILVFVNGGFKYFINVYRGAAGERMLRRLRFQLLERVLRFPLPQFRKTSQGEVVSMVTLETEPLGGFFGEALSLPSYQGGTLVTLMVFTGLIWWENLIFKDGHLIYFQTTPGYKFGADRIESQELIRSFNRSRKTVANFNVKAIAADVRKSNNEYANYFYLIKENEAAVCAVANQYPGNRSSDGSYLSKGDMSAELNICRKKPKGNAAEIEAFIHDFMKKIKFDEGAQNKLIAAGSYNAPTKPTPQIENKVTTSTVKDSTESQSNDNLETRLKILKELFDEGLISKEEAAEKRKAILDSL